MSTLTRKEMKIIRNTIDPSTINPKTRQDFDALTKDEMRAWMCKDEVGFCGQKLTRKIQKKVDKEIGDISYRVDEILSATDHEFQACVPPLELLLTDYRDIELGLWHALQCSPMDADRKLLNPEAFNAKMLDLHAKFQALSKIEEDGWLATLPSRTAA
jgi:hypothetical protein